MPTTRNNITDLRNQIDSIDLEILELLNKRAGLVLEVGKIKAKENKDFYVPEREQEVLKRLMDRNPGPLPNQALKNVFREIMSASLSLEKPLRIAFLGPVATFTHQACMQHFGLSGEFLPKKDIADVFDDVEKGRADFGVVPIENSTEGVVSHTLDMFVRSDLKIYSEVMLEISLALLNKTGKITDIAKVCSHPHALAQCKNWVKGNLPNALVFDVSSTALAAQMAAEDSSTAAIASIAAANLYDLRVIEKNIEDNSNNFTRFLVISKNIAGKTGRDKTSLMFAIKDAPGALYSMLKPFASRGLNLSKIESRPLKTKAWEYVFFLDLDGHINDEPVREAISELEKSCSFLKILGSYSKSQQA
ncbi:MAG TPA: prephenate dehydratase [Deltaproteobacteria bacterium]|nr:MAG: chorismate mutase [Deltaproteobacteria bacterium GWA2_55_82]OGQ63030.1 MAG: chorismate mutase [Deltaproteobacteria bacterium RIFCSPLOWO2_02_FULL_55_12]OIJ72995.1 MAG: chorismate mutase [Deltaproteobacteria bacterium GWC2_55_46]HBG45995.1 prephenate dehydratase [Deltaproteobacteria bacterium]HCY11787.1 prephenate dehydratase [Deltaproteobacteria bacterium]